MTRTLNGWAYAGVIAASLVVGAPRVFAHWWSPSQFAKERTLKLRTRCNNEGERWLRERFVVLDGQMYVRLGRRDAERVQCNGTTPLLGVEVAKQRFERVRGIPAPQFVERVDKAMADKYVTDFAVRLFAHPLTMRLHAE
jgi:hypothetical protein